MTTRKRRKKRRVRVNRRMAPVLVALLLIIVVMAGMGISYLIEKYSPSKERMAWTEYYSATGEDEVAVILNNELTDIKGRMIDGEVYVTTDTLYEYLNDRFYWTPRRICSCIRRLQKSLQLLWGVRAIR